MSTFTLTLLIAFIFIMLSLIGIGIGWLLTGKSIIKPGMCGRNPTKKKDDKSCGDDARCDLCEDDDDEKKQS